MKIVKKTLKNRDILALFNEFNTNIDKEGLNPAYSLMLFKNADALFSTVKKINDELYDERREPEFNDFIIERNGLYEKYADRDEQGQIKIDEKTNIPVITEMIVEFNNGLNELQEKYKALIEKIQNKDNVNNEILQQTSEVEIITLAISEFPYQAKPFVVGLLAE